MTERLLIDKAAGVLTITFNRPEKKNALTVAEYARLGALIDAANDDPEVRAILIQAAGDTFTGGHDVSEFAAISAGGGAPPARGESPAAEPFLLALANARKPLVAAVHGRAVGIGLTLLLHCDLVYVAEDALLSCPFVNLALAPEAASSLLLPARIGHVRAFELFVLGAPIDGRTAVEWGIANAALPAGEVQARARAAAEALATKPAAAVRVTKALMRDIPAMVRRIDQEFGHFYAQLGSSEAKEAFAAFFEKRAADFSRI